MLLAHHSTKSSNAPVPGQPFSATLLFLDTNEVTRQEHSTHPFVFFALLQAGRTRREFGAVAVI